MKEISIRVLDAADVVLLEDMLTMFGEAFDEFETYNAARPGQAYLQKLLGSDYFIAIAAVDDDTVVGGIAAYDLVKFEQERSEIFIYDLAVAESHRRKGVASALIRKTLAIAESRKAHVVFVQAYRGDEPATSLYSKFSVREEILHFEIEVDQLQK
ncbi:MAG: GNAT family N-acetyltransferase [Woeseiaceae bacterium]|nr:GNAT family N-acetyltransferase [Woeseiaceae bacterium]